MIWCDAARMLIIGSIPLTAAFGLLTLAQLYAVAVTAGICTVLFDVSYQSYLPVLVLKDNLVDGNGKLGATQSFAQVTGPGVGGALVGLVGAAGAMAADAISYAVSVTSLLAIRAREEPPPPAPRQTLRAEVFEGLKFVLRHPILRSIAACTGTANLFGAMAAAVEIIFLVRVLHVRPADTGLLIAVGSLGGVVGGVLSGRLRRLIGTARIIWFSMLVLGLPQLIVPLAEPGWRLASSRSASRRSPSAPWCKRGAGQLPAGDLPAAATRADERGRPLGGLGTLPLGGVLGGALGGPGRARHAVDRVRWQLGGRVVADLRCVRCATS